jgi:hypothetical protein
MCLNGKIIIFQGAVWENKEDKWRMINSDTGELYSKWKLGDDSMFFWDDQAEDYIPLEDSDGENEIFPYIPWLLYNFTKIQKERR